MGTPFTAIYDIALIAIRDFRLDNLYKEDMDAFNTYLQGLLISAIPRFTCCLNSLDYDIDSETFNATLTNQEINILAKIMIYNWFLTLVQDVTQVQGKLSSRDYKVHSEASNLKQKEAYMFKLYEQYNQDITDYLVSGSNISKIAWY